MSVNMSGSGAVGLGGRGGELPAGGIRASQGTFSSSSGNEEHQERHFHL